MRVDMEDISMPICVNGVQKVYLGSGDDLTEYRTYGRGKQTSFCRFEPGYASTFNIIFSFV